MNKHEWYSVLKNDQCIHWFLGKDRALYFVRRKLSGKNHRVNKTHKWEIVRGRV